MTNNVYYVGDSLKENDLKRCQIEKAKAVIILCNKQSEDPNGEDAKTILQSMFIKKYLKDSKPDKTSGNSQRVLSVKLCMQILRPEGKTHYYLSNKQTKFDQVVCIEELKLGLLARSCLCPGLPAMIYNLICSTTPPTANAEIDGEWLEDYLKGKSYEVYRVFLPTKYKGKTFSWIASRIYRSFRAILFALEMSTPDGNKIFLNPGQYVLQGLNKITGYIIAQNKNVDDLLTSYQAFVTEEVELIKRHSTPSTPKKQITITSGSTSRRLNSLGIEKGFGFGFTGILHILKNKCFI